MDKLLIVEDDEGIWVEGLPDQARIGYSFFEEVLPYREEIKEWRSFNADDGSREYLTWTFRNGVAVYRFEEDRPEEYARIYSLKSWEPA